MQVPPNVARFEPIPVPVASTVEELPQAPSLSHRRQLMVNPLDACQVRALKDAGGYEPGRLLELETQSNSPRVEAVSTWFGRLSSRSTMGASQRIGAKDRFFETQYHIPSAIWRRRWTRCGGRRTSVYWRVGDERLTGTEVRLAAASGEVFRGRLARVPRAARKRLEDGRRVVGVCSQRRCGCIDYRSANRRRDAFFEQWRGSGTSRSRADCRWSP